MASAAAPASKCFLVTGPPGIGKTTLVMRVVETLRSSHPHLNIRGFYTREIREGSDRIGFEVVTLDGRRGPLASSKLSSSESLGWPNVGKYKVDVASFETLALPELQVKDGTDLYIIDEVGKMELFSSSFLPAVLRVLESDIPILGSIPIPKFGRDIPGGKSISSIGEKLRKLCKKKFTIEVAPSPDLSAEEFSNKDSLIKALKGSNVTLDDIERRFGRCVPFARLRNHPGAAVFTLNAGNRDAIKANIYSQLVNLLPKC